MAPPPGLADSGYVPGPTSTRDPLDAWLSAYPIVAQAPAGARQFPESRPCADTYNVFDGAADATPAKNIDANIATTKANPQADTEVRDLA